MSTNGDTPPHGYDAHDDAPPLGAPGDNSPPGGITEAQIRREARKAVELEERVGEIEAHQSRSDDLLSEHARASRQRDQWTHGGLVELGAKVDRHHEWNVKAHREAADRALENHQALLSAIDMSAKTSGDVRGKLESFHEIDADHDARIAALAKENAALKASDAAKAKTLAEHSKRLTLRDGFVALVIAAVTVLYHLLSGK